jgi:gamma-glutamylcyclotransferase (GGCT)/AIG2-like uncharacterized protein YtfP
MKEAMEEEHPGRRLYFAYGSNMDSDQMAQRCPRAAAAGLGTLPNHRFLINRHGVATVVPGLGMQVQGRLWWLDPEDEESLDHYEGVARGLYRKVLFNVDLPRGSPARALVYVAADQKAGTPREGYLELVIAAARSVELPLEYIAELEAWRGPSKTA